jgi:hypothetical protein
MVDMAYNDATSRANTDCGAAPGYRISATHVNMTLTVQSHKPACHSSEYDSESALKHYYLPSLPMGIESRQTSKHVLFQSLNHVPVPILRLVALL